MKTPKNRLTVVAVALAIYLAGPFREWHYLSTELTRGSFPADADSIVIPFFRFLISWLILGSFAALLIWLALRSYPGRAPLFGINHLRPYWSLTWSVLFAIPVFYELFFAVQTLFRALPLDFFGASLTSYLFLCLRSSIVYKDLPTHKKPS